MYFLMIDHKNVDKYMTIWEKVSNIKKIIISLYITKISKSWNKNQHKRKLPLFLYASNIIWFSL